MLSKLFEDFFKSEKTSGVLLLVCTGLSLLLANSAWGNDYTHFWHTRLDLSFAAFDLNYSLEQWINDGLMTFFFLLVGLEIERELYAGELAHFSAALLPMVAAGGGMIVPAAIHYFFNCGTPTQSGFGIPMATDIAFSLGVLSLAGSRVSYSLKIFLTALAIIDDIGAIIIIAVFYNAGIHWLYFFAAAGILALLFLLRKLKVHHLAFYLLPGLVLWYCTVKSGIHPTIAGVLLAFVIPYSGNDETTPSYRLQKALHKPVGYLIVPLFALANTAIVLRHDWLAQMTTANSFGIIAGLTLGKPIGILFFSWLLTKFCKASLPEGIAWKTMLGAAMLAGIGFTMSIFISNLAFSDLETVSYSKIAVLLASLMASIAGLAILFTAKRQTK